MSPGRVAVSLRPRTPAIQAVSWVMNERNPMGQLNISKTTTIDTSADKLWTILADQFTDVGSWSSSVASSGPNQAANIVLDGAPVGGRICEVPGFGSTDERLTHFDADKKTFTYSLTADKIPRFVTGMRNTWTLTSQPGGKTLVGSQIRGNAGGIMGALMGPMMKMKFKKTIGDVLTDLKIYAESGEASAAKKKQLVKAAKH